MKGYWNLPEETAKAFDGDWFRTGDAGYLDEAGFLYIYDRVKDMIISGGENVYPAEVESALYGHLAIADVAVTGTTARRSNGGLLDWIKPQLTKVSRTAHVASA